MNANQVSQFASLAWICRMKRIGPRISMDGKGDDWTTSAANACGIP
jgi:hypothetical protein